MIVSALLVLLAAGWVAWTGWRAGPGSPARMRASRWAAGLSIAGAAGLLPSYVLAFAVGVGSLPGGDFAWPSLLIPVPFLLLVAFGAVALLLAPSGRQRALLVGLTLLAALLVLLGGGWLGL
ncbi:hypothetical protein [Deinococcus aestuarii]|uniref:hypothetical protein n=1 Tax=Deinococcus aestuarii TaxID=2774531 RepID=UPI001C0D92C6|nr:hypothetical protein [Deinococcus aestuarii]